MVAIVVERITVSAGSSKRTNFPRGTWSGSKWPSFDNGYYHDALFPATVSIFHPHVDKKRLGRSVCVGGCMHGRQWHTGKHHDHDRHVTTDPCTCTARESPFRGCWLNTTIIGVSPSSQPRISPLYNTLVYTEHYCRKYVINVGNQRPVL